MLAGPVPTGIAGFHELPRRDTCRLLRAWASIELIALEDRDAVVLAVDAFAKSPNFADTLPLARASRACGFATFD